MFCPRCGVQIVETTRFCKSCGMALAPVIDFVASGGTRSFGDSGLTGALSGFSPAQKVLLFALMLVFSPILIGVLPFFVPIAIVWMILRHNEKKRHVVAPAAVPPYFQPPQVQPPPTNLIYGSQPPAPQPALQTGPLISEAAPGSVVEDETRRFPK